MKCFTLIGLAILTTSCSAKVVEPHKNCALPPNGFWSYNNEKFWEDKGLPIIPILINTITVQKDEETELSGLHDRTVVKWNGTPIDMATLDTYLQITSQMVPQADTNLVFDRGIPCHRVIAIRLAMEKHLVCTQNRVCLQGYQPPAD